MHITPRPAMGVALVIAAAALWGTTGTSQSLAGGTLSSVWFGALRLAFATGFFAVVAAATGGLAPGAWRGLPPITAVGAGLCLAVYNLTFFAGVKMTGVGIGTAIALGSGPIWAGLLQAALQHQAPSRRWWMGTIVAILGGMLLSAGAAAVEASAAGVAACLAAGLSYAVYTLLNKRMVAHGPASSIMLAAFGVAALVAMLAAALQAGPPSPGPADLVAIAYTGVVTAGLGYLLYSHALHHISPATGVTLALTEPVIAFLLATLLLAEPADIASVSGLALVVVGVVGVVRAELVSSRPMRRM